MIRTDCDVSPLKDQLKSHLRKMSEELAHIVEEIDKEEICLLKQLEDVHAGFQEIQSLAASFYLQCYLSNFTPHYLDLSICIQHLSSRRHGGLIVIERNDPLDTILHSGIPIQAKLTYSLLESIFYPGNPLHDGAVLIRQDQIISAANVLPVSTISSVNKKMGTRHRAAIGLTEQTDAMVLVVSEETGQASFAYKGSLYAINSANTLPLFVQ